MINLLGVISIVSLAIAFMLVTYESYSYKQHFKIYVLVNALIAIMIVSGLLYLIETFLFC